MMRAFLAYRLAILAAIAVGVFVAPAVVTTGGQSYDRLFPITTDWTPTSIEVEGLDIIVSGTMVKQRCGCAYIPPPRARDEAGVHYRVISSSPTATSSWQCSGAPQRFGPWRIVGAAGQRITIYQEHQCSSLWVSFTTLGEIK